MTMDMMIQLEREDAAITERIETAREFGSCDEKIIQMLMSRFDLTKDEAKEKLFWYDEEKANWEMKMNEPIAIKKLTDEEPQKILLERRLKRGSANDAQNISVHQ